MTDAHRLSVLRGEEPDYDYSNQPDGMRRADGQGFTIHGSQTREAWPRTLLRIIRPATESLEEWHPRWCDHPCVERRQGDPTLYVCHPYNLGPDAFRDFLTLEDAGWCVRVTGRSVYYPGATVRVEVSKPEARTR
ncbi:hypothetical protein [Rhodococcus pyridinivorans]|uniref:hypothetical protein n=1 Tax=Rhodococcus pyridinivorans TaxID=103816 RepID=UPI002283DB29|nr:hypothetical protein [Rhodococcus pyridinivorans]WAL46793.1 hypothetical protein OQN32_01385 [Rhodococcus pyridinivorans]